MEISSYQKSLQPQNLLSYDVLVDDSGAASKYISVNRIPPVFTIGRNSFLLGAGTQFKPGSRLMIEILDSLGNPVFQTPVPTYVEAQSRLISVEIYNTTAPGTGVIVIMGQLLTDDPYWQNKFNYRWTSPILIEPNRANISPIIFESTPGVDVIETRIKNRQTSSFAIQSQSISVDISELRDSNEQIGYLLTARDGFTFSPDHHSWHTGHENAFISGTMHIGAPTESIDVLLDINSVLNTTTAYAQNVISYDDRIIDSMLLKSGTYSTRIFGTDTPVTSSVLLYYDTLSETGSLVYKSYANMRVYNLPTVSGEIHKVRISARDTDVDSNYKLISDVDVPTAYDIQLSAVGELLVTASDTGFVPIGDFYAYTNKFTTASYAWYADVLESTSDALYPRRGTARYYSSSASPTQSIQISYNNTILLNSIAAQVQTSGTTFSGSAASVGYFIGTPVEMEVFENTKYALSLTGFYKKTSGSVTLTGLDPVLSIYLVGVGSSSLTSTNPLGQLIGSVSASLQNDAYYLEPTTFVFSPALYDRGYVSLRLVVNNGFWNFSDISLTPLTIDGFSPDEFTLLIPNTEYYNTTMQYKVEFLDINNNSTSLFVESNPTYFTGSVIDLGALR